MNSKKAIEILLRQKDKLNEIENHNDFWRSQTFSYIQDFFGEDSHEYARLRNTDFAVDWALRKNGIPDEAFELNKKRFGLFLDSCIETIKDKGIKKSDNWLKKIPNEWLVSVILFVASALFVGGTYWGKYLSDTQNIELKRENKDLKNRLKSLSSIIRPLYKSSDTIPSDKTKPDTPANN